MNREFGSPFARFARRARKPPKSHGTGQRQQERAGEPCRHRPCKAWPPARLKISDVLGHLADLIGHKRQALLQRHDGNIILKICGWLRDGLRLLRVIKAGRLRRHRLHPILHEVARWRLQPGLRRRIDQRSEVRLLRNRRTHDCTSPLRTHTLKDTTAIIAAFGSPSEMGCKMSCNSWIWQGK